MKDFFHHIKQNRMMPFISINRFFFLIFLNFSYMLNFLFFIYFCQKKDAHEQMVRWINNDMRPFHIVQTEAFKTFMSACNPDFTIPSPKRIKVFKFFSNVKNCWITHEFNNNETNSVNYVTPNCSFTFKSERLHWTSWQFHDQLWRLVRHPQRGIYCHSCLLQVHLSFFFLRLRNNSQKNTFKNPKILGYSQSRESTKDLLFGHIQSYWGGPSSSCKLCYRLFDKICSGKPQLPDRGRWKSCQSGCSKSSQQKIHLGSCPPSCTCCQRSFPSYFLLKKSKFAHFFAIFRWIATRVGEIDELQPNCYISQEISCCKWLFEKFMCFKIRQIPQAEEVRWKPLEQCLPVFGQSVVS